MDAISVILIIKLINNTRVSRDVGTRRRMLEDSFGTNLKYIGAS